VNPLTEIAHLEQRPTAERRRAVRLKTDELACLRILNPASPDPIEIRVLNVSKGGFKLCVKQFLQRGTTVQIRHRETIAQGEVRYCVPAGGRFQETGFYVGVQIQELLRIPRVGK
jgi:hypothetical protein